MPISHKIFSQAGSVRNYLPSLTKKQSFKCSNCGMQFNPLNDQLRHEHQQLQRNVWA